MRLKFKPNVNVPRGSGTGTSGASEAGGVVKGASGDAGGGGEAKRRRKRQKSKGGEESAGTEGESSSELETSKCVIVGGSIDMYNASKLECPQ